MQTTIFEIKFYNGAKFNVFCANSSQVNRFLKFILKNRSKVEYWKNLVNGIHTITEFEKTFNNCQN